MTGSGGRRPAVSGRRGGCGVRLLFLLVVIGAVVSLAWMVLLPFWFTRTVRERTGFDATVTSLSANLFTGRVSIRGLVITNPPTFMTSDCLQVRSFEADADIWSFFGERLSIDTLTLDIRELTWVRRAQGPSNLEAFAAGLVRAEPGPPRAKSPLIIRRLHLRLDQLVLADFGEAKPRVRTYTLGLDQQFGNISTLGQLFVPEVFRGLAERDLAAGLGPFLPPGLRGAFNEASKTWIGSSRSAERASGEPFRGFLDKLEETRKP